MARRRTSYSQHPLLAPTNSSIRDRSHPGAELDHYSTGERGSVHQLLADPIQVHFDQLVVLVQLQPRSTMGRGAGSSMRASTPGFMVQLLLVSLAVAALTSTATAQLVPNFYKKSCPRAETLIASAVNSEVNRQPGAASGILRMFFHDCFVHGCDASVLIEAAGSERFHPANAGLHGFDVIDAAKAAVEEHCPGVVSCADILALATQLSVKKLSGGRITYKVPLGRRDGLVSSEAEVNGKLPRETASVADLKTMFASNGLSTEDMVALSGAHSVGTSGCDKIQNRLTASPPDATLDPTYAAVLTKQCPPSAGSGGGHDCHWEWECQEQANARVNLDLATPTRLDEVYYKNLQANRGLLTSDQNLQVDNETRPMVGANTAFRTFGPNFARAMVKMGNIVHLSGTEGNIRLTCSRFN